MLFFSIYYWPLLFFCTMAHVFIYCAPHPFRERVFQTPTMRGMIRTGIIFIATQTLSNSALPHIQNKGILKEKFWTIMFDQRRHLCWLVLVDTQKLSNSYAAFSWFSYALYFKLNGFTTYLFDFWFTMFSNLAILVPANSSCGSY